MRHFKLKWRIWLIGVWSGEEGGPGLEAAVGVFGVVDEIEDEAAHCVAVGGFGAAEGVAVGGIFAYHLGARIFEAGVDFAYGVAECIFHLFVAAAEDGNFVSMEVERLGAIYEIVHIFLKISASPC